VIGEPARAKMSRYLSGTPSDGVTVPVAVRPPTRSLVSVVQLQLAPSMVFFLCIIPSLIPQYVQSPEVLLPLFVHLCPCSRTRTLASNIALP